MLNASMYLLEHPHGLARTHCQRVSSQGAQVVKSVGLENPVSEKLLRLDLDQSWCGTSSVRRRGRGTPGSPGLTGYHASLNA